MLLNKHLTPAHCLGLAICWATQANASGTVYDNAARFAAAAGVTTTYGFNGVPVSSAPGNASGPQTVGDVNFSSTGYAFTIAVGGGEVFTQRLPPNAGIDTNFIDFISTAHITGLTLAAVANVAAPPPCAYNLDIVDFTVGPRVSPVPEPAGWALMLAGLSIVGGLGLRRRGRGL